MKISTRIVALLIGGFLLLGIIVLSYNAASFRRQGAAELSRSMEMSLSQRKRMLQTLVSNVYTMVESNHAVARDPDKLAELYKKELSAAVGVTFSVLEYVDGLKIPDQLKRHMALRQIGALRFDAGEYFWIIDQTPAMVMHPRRPDLDGQDLSDFQDAGGKRPFVEMVEAARNPEGGFVHYLWPPAESEAPRPKLSFVRLFEPWGWVVGAGVFLDVAERDIQEQVLRTIGAFRFGPDNLDYFYVFGAESGKMLQYPREEWIGEAIDAETFRDPEGGLPLEGQRELAQAEGEGFVRHPWPRPGTNETTPKLTYVRHFPPWDWVIATGAHLDDLEAAAQVREAEIAGGVRRRMLRLTGILAGVGAAVCVLLWLVVGRKIVRPIRGVIDALGDNSARLSRSAEAARESGRSLTDSNARQSGVLLEAADSLDRVGAALRQNRETVGFVDGRMETAGEIVDRAEASMTGMGRSMEEMTESSRRIRTIIDAIDDIAFQTNLLALNAAVEAARAGQAGAGFSVVAQEVRNLAGRAAEASRDTRALIEKAAASVERGRECTDAAREAYRRNVEITGETRERMRALSEASDALLRDVEELGTVVREVKRAVEENQTGAERNMARSDELNDLAEELGGIVDRLESVIGLGARARRAESGSDFHAGSGSGAAPRRLAPPSDDKF
ncbi:MAG: methyl-accepting chemotaxis protein [Desulfococcaceae bacterium]